MSDYQESPETISHACTALLATVRHVLTGKEIAAVEWALSDLFEADVELSLEELDDEPESEDFDDEDDFDNAHEEWESRADDISKAENLVEGNFKLIDSLRIQYSREIGEFIDNENRTASRRAVETHNRLHPIA